MFDYGEMLRFLADNPPGSDAERNAHASLLELIATCVREDGPEPNDMHAELAALMSGCDEATRAIEDDSAPAMSPDQSDALAQLRRRYAGTFAAHAAFAARAGEVTTVKPVHVN
ncbi:MAG: hypothetical protein AAFZ01_11780 [Pseudomonadota bacterium]